MLTIYGKCVPPMGSTHFAYVVVSHWVAFQGGSLGILEREEERKDEDHYYSHENLHWESYLYIIHECILSC